jgi:hypothetical protein
MNCWICGSTDAATREHRTKATDLKDLFGTPSQQDPLYFHSNARPSKPARRNVPIGSLNSKALKYTHRICLACNSTTTQPYDYAWAYASSELRSNILLLSDRASFRANWLFPYKTRQGMRNLHLYFVKLFGCQIVEGDIPIDISPFAKSILERKPNSNLFLSFGQISTLQVAVAGGSDVYTDIFNGQVVFASWIYQVGDLYVNVMYAVPSQNRHGLQVAWHPHMGSKRISFSKF